MRRPGAVFSPDGSQLVVTTHDGPAVHVWDLRAIRKQLARMDLDWDAPAYSDDEPASRPLPPLAPFTIDMGAVPLTGDIGPRVYESLIADLEGKLARKPDQPVVRLRLARLSNNLAWHLATGIESIRDPRRALTLARRAVELDPKSILYANTLGVSQYRNGDFKGAVVSLELSLTVSAGDGDGFDLFFLAMAHEKLGHRAEARACHRRGVRWLGDQKNLIAAEAEELAAFRAEAEAVLAERSGELPANVFAF